MTTSRCRTACWEQIDLAIRANRFSLKQPRPRLTLLPLEGTMRKLIAAIMLLLSTIFVLSQTTPKFRPGTIMAVTPIPTVRMDKTPTDLPMMYP